MEKSEYLELDSFFLPKTPIPIYSERAPYVNARTLTNPAIYHPSYPSRDEVRKAHYQRRQDQMQNQGFYTPNTKPYKEIGGPLVLDARQLTILSLTQPTGKVPGSYIMTQLALGDISLREIDKSQLASDRSGHKIEAGSTAESEESNEQRLRLYRLKHQGEVMDVKKEAKAMQIMSRFASNGLPLQQLLNRVDDFRRMAKHGAAVNIKGYRRGKIKHDSDDANHIALNNVLDEDSSSEEASDTTSQAASSSARAAVNNPMKMTDLPRPYSAAHFRIGTQGPDDRSSISVSEHLYRQLCALCWLLDSISNNDPNLTICPIVQSWNLQALNNMKVNIQETQQKSSAIENSWSSFLSHHHANGNGLAGPAASKRSNMKQGGSKYATSVADSARKQHGTAMSIVTSVEVGDTEFPSELPSGTVTERIPPMVPETPNSMTLNSNAESDNQPKSNGEMVQMPTILESGATLQQQHPQVANTVSLQLPSPPSMASDTSPIKQEDDTRSRTSSSMQTRTAKSAMARMSRSGSALKLDSAQKPGSARINYSRLTRDREFLTAKLHEVETEIEREERYRSFRTSKGKANTNSSLPDSNGHSGVSKEILEFTTRAASARYHSLANRSQHRFKTAGEEQSLIVSDQLQQMASRRVELLRLKFLSLEMSSGAKTTNSKPASSTPRPVAESFDRATRRLRAKTAAAERARQLAVEQANEEKQRDWLGALRTFLPQQLLQDWRGRKILERLERHVNMRPNQTTDLNRFIDTLKTLRAFEICDPDVAAAVEFCRERILRFPVSEFEDFFKKHFPTVVRPLVVEKKKRNTRTAVAH